MNVMFVDAKHAKNLPGHKTDVSDAQWFAELGAHGLVRGSFVPPVADPPITGSDQAAHAADRAAGPGDPALGVVVSAAER